MQSTNIYENTTPQPVSPVIQPQPQVGTPNNVPVIPPVPKKGFPKIIIIIGAILIVSILAFIVIRSIRSKVSPSGNITWWGLWEDESTVAPLITEYQNSHPGVKITYIKESQQDYRERLTNALAKGAGPDIFTIHNSWTPMFRNDLDSLPAAVMNPADYAKTYYGVMSSDLTNGNSIVGIPLGYDALTLYVNDDIFSAAGKTPPVTWDNLRVLARQLTVKDDKGAIVQSGIALGTTENVDHWPEILALMMIQNNVDLGNPTGKNAEGALIFYTNFALVDGVWDASLPPSTQAFGAGKLAMYIAPSWRAFEIKTANPNLKFHTAPLPQLPKDNPNQPDISYATYWAQAVWSKSPNKTVAWNFLNFLATQDSLQKMFQSASSLRGFGQAYPRSDMASLLLKHPILGPIVSQAAGAKSWYLASRTFDGPTGINSQLTNYFGDAVNAVATNKQSAAQALATCAQGVQQVLAQYRLVR